jgi:hypothetical protein
MEMQFQFQFYWWGCQIKTAKLRHLILLLRVTYRAPLEMLLGARIYLQLTTNLNAQLRQRKCFSNHQKNKFFLQKGEKSEEKAGERS